MNLTPLMALTFVLLALAICSVWLPPINLASSRRVPVWVLLFAAAVMCGLAAGVLRSTALLSLGALTAFAFFATSERTPPTARVMMATLAALTTLALGFQALPGFNNPILIENTRFSPEAALYTQRASFGKASAGLIMFAFFCNRARSIADWRIVFKRSVGVAIITVASVIVLGLALGFVRPSFKLPAYAPVFLATNLLFTCVAEEAFFRGFLQERLTRLLQAKQIALAIPIAIAVCALAFGLVHTGGGVWYVALAALAGVGYGYAYARTRSIEAPILVHFLLNAVHFIGFTYPRVA